MRDNENDSVRTSSFVKRVSCCVSSGLAIFGLTFFCLSFLYGNPLNHHTKHHGEQNVNGIDDDHGETRLQTILKTERELIRKDMAGYQYPDGRYNISAQRLEDLLTEENGNPVRSIIVSTYRSGSTFLGSIVAAHPGNLYHFEPISDFDFVQVRGPPLAAEAITRILALLNCDYAELDDYLRFAKYRPWYFGKSANLWERCNVHKMCYDRTFLSATCKLFPFQSMKLVRLRLNILREIIPNLKLNVRIVYLVRDPRGTMRSRKNVWFYDRGPDVSETELLCGDLVADYKAAVILKEEHPTQFKVVRYEDLATDPYNQTREILNFFGRDFHPKVEEYLDTHTTTDVAGDFGTQRNSKTTPFHWRTDLEFGEVDEIQRTCATAMKYWGYLPAINATHQQDFNPVTTYALN